MSQIKHAPSLVLIMLAILAIFPLFNVSGATGEKMITDKGTSGFGCTVPIGSDACSPPAQTFHTTFPQPPNMTITFLRDDYGGLTVNLPPSVITMLAPGNLGETWTAQPAATTEIFGTINNRFHFSGAGGSALTLIEQDVNVNVVSAGVAGSVLEVQTSVDQITWSDSCTTPGAGDIAISSTGLNRGACAINPIAAGTFLRLVGKNGNGVASPNFGLITIQYDQSVLSVFTGWFFSAGPTTTGFSIVLFTTFQITSAQGPQTENLQWTAYECVNGGNLC